MFNINNTPFIVFIISGVILLLLIVLYRKIAPTLHWLYKVNKNYKYFQKATGITKLKALIMLGKFVYNQAQLNALNEKLMQENEALRDYIVELENVCQKARNSKRAHQRRRRRY